MVICVFALASVLIGMLVSLLVLLPPLRRWGRNSVTGKALEMIICGLLALPLTLGVFARINAEIAFAFGGQLVAPHDEVESNRAAIVNELWMRDWMQSAFIKRPCYTSQVVICNLADKVSSALHKHINSDPADWLIGLGVILLPPLLGSAVGVHRLTQSSSKASQI